MKKHKDHGKDFAKYGTCKKYIMILKPDEWTVIEYVRGKLKSETGKLKGAPKIFEHAPLLINQQQFTFKYVRVKGVMVAKEFRALSFETRNSRKEKWQKPMGLSVQISCLASNGFSTWPYEFMQPIPAKFKGKTKEDIERGTVEFGKQLGVKGKPLKLSVLPEFVSD